MMKVFEDDLEVGFGTDFYKVLAPDDFLNSLPRPFFILVYI